MSVADRERVFKQGGGSSGNWMRVHACGDVDLGHHPASCSRYAQENCVHKSSLPDVQPRMDEVVQALLGPDGPGPGAIAPGDSVAPPRRSL